MILALRGLLTIALVLSGGVKLVRGHAPDIDLDASSYFAIAAMELVAGAGLWSRWRRPATWFVLALVAGGYAATRWLGFESCGCHGPRVEFAPWLHSAIAWGMSASAAVLVGWDCDSTMAGGGTCVSASASCGID